MFIYTDTKLALHSPLQGIAYLHDRNIVHRDLKTDNLLLFNNFQKLKICDFGTVREIGTNNTAEIGTANYMAPEVCITHLPM